MKKVGRDEELRKLHVKGKPLILYNVWDAGSAAALTEAGAKAIATSSWAIGAAHGYPDGEQLPIDFLLRIVERIVHSTDVPVTIDFEGGYARSPADVGRNVSDLVRSGAAGMNFEDQVVNGPGLYSIDEQTQRIREARLAADRVGGSFFINARSDVFFKGNGHADHALLIDEALERGRAYLEAGADGFFVPGLVDKELIKRICTDMACPVNVMVTESGYPLASIVQLGVARISFGPSPYIEMIRSLKAEFQSISSGAHG